MVDHRAQQLRALDKEGYVLFENAIDVDRVEDARSKYNSRDGTVDYAGIQKFIDREMLQYVNGSLGWDCDYIKYRVSDNNNSADASTFHRDLIYQGDARDERVDVYTCLAYLDDTFMEVIPGSHNALAIPLGKLAAYPATRIAVRRGHILLFHATLLHRGIFFNALNSETRKVVQIFEVFSSPAALQKNKDLIIHVTGDEKYSDTMQRLSKHPVSTYFLNWVGYLNAATGYGQVPKDVLKKDGGGAFLFISSEGLRGREEGVKPHELHPSQSPANFTQVLHRPQNKYIVKHATNLMDDKHRHTFNLHCYHHKFYATAGVFVVMLIIIIWMAYLLFKTVWRATRQQQPQGVQPQNALTMLDIGTDA